MNDQTLGQGQGARRNDMRINVLLNKLQSKLRDFAVQDRNNLLLGKVKDVNLDSERQLNLVISQEGLYQNSPLFLIKSKHIQQVDSSRKTLFVALSKEETQYLPEYVPSEQTTGGELLETAPTSSTTAWGVTDASTASAIPTADELNNHPEELERDSMPADAYNNFSTEAEVVEEEIFRLLEERLIVDNNKHKVGEVIVRKEIETRMVEVPVRREILIVEQVSPEHKQLAEIDLGQGEIPNLELIEAANFNAKSTSDSQLTVTGEFDSPRTASRILDAIAHQRRHGCAKVRVEIILEDAEHQATYQEWFDRCSIKQSSNGK
ncbi:DUF2382 domain-containing protein [Coleofasciculus sp. FACHB-1120]|uniref:YsnF/AvaK domain-containing protein n=1 Tax=Coleofasciculus sp. FACHB-1120 TaxID=2692783 RepID=UPI0016894610|nr:DUF2382 domain-containing protein [Coleofasciculus sp. FACHB-1120]MBD2742022.1 DUF2382 domain-containing protein [Coleofasciculus sp. FACHB-1120]